MKTIEKVIGSSAYRVKLFVGRKRMSCTLLLGRLCSGLMADMKSGVDVGAAFTRFLSTMQSDDFEAVCGAFEAATEVRIDGAWTPLRERFDTHFAGRFDEMFAWLLWAFEVNYGHGRKASPGGERAPAGARLAIRRRRLPTRGQQAPASTRATQKKESN